LPLCPDCLHNDGRLEIMINVGEEVCKKKIYVILECITCGSSVRVPKESTDDLKELSIVDMERKKK
jgi:hypothetical protein